MPEQAELWSLRTTHSLLGALRSENAASRAFAAYMPTGLCLAASMAGGFGHSTLEADFPTKPVPFTASDRKRIEATCARVHHQEKLRGTVLAALKEQQAPMTSFFKATDGSPSAARAQLARVLADEDPTALFPLNIVWPLYNTERMAETVPQELRMYSQGIVAAAFDIALCRSAAYCGPDGFPREQVCARFGECDEPDVESAYRRLHSEAGIPFAVTSNMADWIRDAIARRDTLALWPDTVKFPTRRK